MKLHRLNYDKALAALKGAHEACFQDKQRPLLGMSYGPFSGVNKALSIVATLEDENNRVFADYRARYRL